MLPNIVQNVLNVKRYRSERLIKVLLLFNEFAGVYVLTCL